MSRPAQLFVDFHRDSLLPVQKQFNASSGFSINHPEDRKNGPFHGINCKRAESDLKRKYR